MEYFDLSQHKYMIKCMDRDWRNGWAFMINCIRKSLKMLHGPHNDRICAGNVRFCCLYMRCVRFC